MNKPINENEIPVKEEKKKKKRGCLIVLIIFLALLISALIVTSVFVSRMLGQIEREDEVVETLSQEEIDAIYNETDPVEDILDETEAGLETVPEEEDFTIPDETVEPVQSGDDIINILLVGQDTANSKRRSRTDSMILCTINKKTKTLTMTSFMRDLYVKIPGYADQRLNVPYVLGGFKKLYQTLEYNFGVEVDYGIAVNFSSFKKVIDAVGGVDIELTKAEAKHLNKQNDEWELVKGVNHLDGEQALAYSRIRKIDSDFNRTSRQRKVIKAVVNGAKSMSVTELYSLVETLIPMVKTDMTDAEILGTAVELAPMLMDLEIKTQRIPINGEYKSKTIKGMSVLVADNKANRKFLQETIGDND